MKVNGDNPRTSGVPSISLFLCICYNKVTRPPLSYCWDYSDATVGGLICSIICLTRSNLALKLGSTAISLGVFRVLGQDRLYFGSKSLIGFVVIHKKLWTTFSKYLNWVQQKINNNWLLLEPPWRCLGGGYILILKPNLHVLVIPTECVVTKRPG